MNAILLNIWNAFVFSQGAEPQKKPTRNAETISQRTAMVNRIINSNVRLSYPDAAFIADLRLRATTFTMLDHCVFGGSLLQLDKKQIANLERIYRVCRR